MRSAATQQNQPSLPGPTEPASWIEPRGGADQAPLLASDNGRILVVDDEVTIRELLAQFLTAQGFECSTADSGQTAIGRIEQDRFDLVISDIRMPHLTGLQLLDHIHANHPTLPVIMITAVADLETAVDAMKQGATDYITKPFDLKKVSASVRGALKERLSRLQNDQLQSKLRAMLESQSYALDSALKTLTLHRDMTLEALVRALDARESETRCHSLRVQTYAIRLARQFNLDGYQLEEIARGALLHDIGKIGISDAILLKPGKLTDEEWVEMRKHPIFGYEILKGIDFLDGASELVLRHHERWDGSGYPGGLAGSAIPFGARLFAIVDTYDAITSDRPYRKALTAEHARQEIQRLAGSLYDREIAEAFLAIPQVELDEISAFCLRLGDPPQ